MTSIADYAAWRHIANSPITPPATTSTTLWTVANAPIRARIAVYVTAGLSGAVNFTIANDGANLCSATACPTAPGSVFVPVTVGAAADTSTALGGNLITVATLLECQPSTITLTTSATVTGTIRAEIWYIPLGNASVS